MMVRIIMTDTADVAAVTDGLLEAAERWEIERPFLARKYIALANRIGDELDALPYPSDFRAQVEAKRAQHKAARAS